MGLWSKVKGMFGDSAPAAEPPVASAATAEESAEQSAQDLFSKQVAAAMSQHLSLTPRPGRRPFSLDYTRDGQDGTAYLDNIFSETRDMTPADRAARIQRFVLGLTEGADADELPWQAVRERLVPVLRSATFFSMDKPGSDSNPIRRPFTPFLIGAVGIDSDNSFRYVARATVEKWGVDLDTAFATARENAERYFDGSDVAPYGGDKSYPLWHVARDDSYESSRLLVPGWLASFAGKVKGRPVAIVPSRSRLIVGGDGDERGLKQLMESARREYEASPRSISPAVYTVDAAGAVTPLVLPASHPLAVEVALGHAMLAVQEYSVQKERLEQQLGDDIYAAKLTAYKRADRCFTMTTWTREATVLLPRADEVALVTVEGEKAAVLFTIKWQPFMDLAGSCLRFEQEHDPPRWRTDRWPDPVTLEKLKAAASSKP